MPARSMPWCAVKTGRRASAGMNATGRFSVWSSLTKYDTGRLSAPAILSSVVMVGTIPDRSILWMAAADTSARSASCCSERPRCTRSSRSFGPIELTICCSPPGPGSSVAAAVVEVGRHGRRDLRGRSSDVARLTAGHARPS